MNTMGKSTNSWHWHNQDESQVYLSIWLFAFMLVCLTVCSFFFFSFTLSVRSAIVHFSRVSKLRRCNPIDRKEICYFVNFEICWRHNADSETFILFYQCNTLYVFSVLVVLLLVCFFPSLAQNLLWMIAMRELFYYYLYACRREVQNAHS